MIHEFYVLPKEFEQEFRQSLGASQSGINIEDFVIGVDSENVTTFPDFLTFETAWLGSWRAFFDEKQGQSISQKEIFEYCDRLSKLFQLDQL